MRLRRVWAGVGLGALVVVLGSGCGVATRVSLTVDHSGHGAVGVSVTLDRAAVQAVGGAAAMRSELAVQDLVRAGWAVTGPRPDESGAVTVTVSHGFNSLQEAGRLMSDIAGPDRFRLFVTSHRSFWHTSYRLSGDIDLTCGLACFGDPALKAATGSVVGVDPASLPGAGAQSPAGVFSFAMDARLPGRLQATNAGAVTPGKTLVWTTRLGGALPVAAATQTVNGGNVVAVVSAGAVVLIGLAAGLWFWVFRGRRLRRTGRGRHARRRWPRWRRGRGPVDEPGNETAGVAGEAVTPPS